MEKYPTLYKVSYWDEDTSKEIYAQGIIYSTSLIDAIEQITDWYGDDNISSVTVNLLEHQLFELTETEYNAFLKRG